ncbi:Coiled-coil protein [Giardia lamblia P15]|uniref:Coiled-coil protein n=1 Tax=Giardia intestinalis (strain P15) TaxID=658858 RepID=E1F0K8_GIAIA|nr:Coiled-coil protein [Giardia lamblia P15]
MSASPDSAFATMITPTALNSLDQGVRNAIMALQSELESERERARKFENQVAVLSSNDPSGLYNKYIDMETTSELLKQAVQKAIEEREALEKQYQNLRADFSSLQADLAAKEETLRFLTEGNDAAKQLSMANSEIAALKLEISDLDASLKRLTDDAERLRGECEDLRGENENLKNALHRVDETMTNIRSHQDSTAPGSTHGSAYDGNEFYKPPTAKDTKSDDTDAPDYQKLYLQQSDQISSLQAELDKLRYLANPDDQYSGNIASLNYQVHKLFEDNKKSQARINELTAQKEANDAIIHGLEQELVHLRSGSATAGSTDQAELSNLRNKLTATEIELRSKKQEIEAVRSETTAMGADYYALQAEIEKYKKLEHDLSVDVTLLRQQLAEVRGQAPETDALQVELSNLRQLSNRLEQELLALRKALGSTGITGVEIQLKRKDIEIARLNERVELLLNTSPESGDTVDNLSRRLMNVQEDLKTKEQLLSNYENHLTAMNGVTPDKVEELTSQVATLTAQNSEFAHMLNQQGRGQEVEIIEGKNARIKELEDAIKSYKSIIDNLVTANVASNKEVSQMSEALILHEQTVASLAESLQTGMGLRLVNAPSDQQAPATVGGDALLLTVPDEYKIPDEVKQSSDPRVLRDALQATEQTIAKLYDENVSKTHEIEQLHDALKSHEHALVSIREANLAKDQEIDQLNDALAHQEKTVGSLVATLSPRLGTSAIRDRDGLIQMGSPVYDYSDMPPSEAELEMLREAVKHAEDTIAAMREANAAKDKEIEELGQALALQEQTVTSLCQTLSPSFTVGPGAASSEDEGPLDNRIKVPPETLEKLRELEHENEKLKHDMQLLQNLEKYLPGGHVYEENVEKGDAGANMAYLLAHKDVELENLNTELKDQQDEIKRLKEAMFSREEVIAKVSYIDANKSKEIEDLHEAMRKQEEIVQNLCASLSPDLTAAMAIQPRSGDDPDADDTRPRYNMEELIAELQKKISELVDAERVAEKDAEIDRLKRQLAYQENPILERTAINELMEKETHIKKLQDVIERQDKVIDELKNTVIHRENEINNMSSAKAKIEHVLDLQEKSGEASRTKLTNLSEALAKQENLVERLLNCLSPQQRDKFLKEEEETKKLKAAREEELASTIRDLQEQLDRAKNEGGSTKEASALLTKASGKMIQWFKERPKDMPNALDIFS